MATTMKPEFVTEEGFGYDMQYGRQFVRLTSGKEVLFRGHEHLLRVEIRELNNYIPPHFDGEPAIVDGGVVNIWSDDYQIYTFRFTSIDVAVSRLVQVLDRLRNFPVPLTNRKHCEDLIGRKVYWREIPAKISDFDGQNGRVRLITDGFRFTLEPWDKDMSDDNPVLFSDTWEDLLSPRIHWFRGELR